MSLIYDEDLRGIRQELKKLSNRICCDDCIEVSETCLDGQVPVYDTATGTWQCGDASGGVTSVSESGEAQLTGDVTLSEGDNITLTQVGQDIEISTHDPVTLNGDVPTQNALNLSDQEIQVNVATQTEYGVVKLEDLYANFVQVANFAALPAAGDHTGEYYHVLASQGTAWLPGSLGGTYYQKGIYLSDGVNWNFVSESPYNATQPTVDTGTNNDQFVTPLTLASAAQWDTKNDSIQFQDEGVNLGTSGTVDTIDFVGSAVTAARVGNAVTVTVTGSSPAVISPAQITADQDNYSPTDWATATIVRLSFDSSIPAITGFAAKSDGDRVTVFNVSGNSGYIPGEHPDSSAANRVSTKKDFIIYPYTDFELIYDGTSSRWRVIGAEDDARKTGVFYSWTPGSVTVGDWGQIGFTALSSGTVTQLAASTTLPGASQLSTSTNIAGGFGLHYAKAVNDFSAFGSAHIFSECLLSIPTLSDGTETFTVELKITADPFPVALEDDNSVAIRYSHGINSGEWELYSQDNASAETVDGSGIAVVATSLYKLRIEVNKANTEVRAYINDASVGVVAGTMPNTVGCGAQVIIRKSLGTTARTLNVHAFSAGAIYV